MASSTTTNYKLNQWAATDKILMTEINNDNKLIDDALAKKLDKAATAASATTASKLGTATVGSATVPIYLDAGTPKAVNKVAAASKADSATSATTATKLGAATVGNATAPIYLNAGAPTAASAMATAAQMTALTNRVAALEKMPTIKVLTSHFYTMDGKLNPEFAEFDTPDNDLDTYSQIYFIGAVCFGSAAPSKDTNIPFTVTDGGKGYWEYPFVIQMDPSYFKNQIGDGIYNYYIRINGGNDPMRFTIYRYLKDGKFSIMSTYFSGDAMTSLVSCYFAPVWNSVDAATAWNALTKYTPRCYLLLIK